MITQAPTLGINALYTDYAPQAYILDLPLNHRRAGADVTALRKLRRRKI